MAHISVNHIEAEVIHHTAHLGNALMVGSNLGTQVGDVLVGVASGPLARCQQITEGLLAERAVMHQPKVLDHHAFFLDNAARGRHRAWRDATDICVVTARSDVEEDLAASPVENRRDDGDIGQMGAAGIRRVEYGYVARPLARTALANDCAHTLAHRAQMHRHVRCVGNEIAIAVEHRTGKI